MIDYKAMYLKMVCETERAINILIEAQRECEKLYINAPETKIRPMFSNQTEEE